MHEKVGHATGEETRSTGMAACGAPSTAREAKAGANHYGAVAHLCEAPTLEAERDDRHASGVASGRLAEAAKREQQVLERVARM